MRVFAPALVICLLSFLAQQTRPATPVEQVGVVAGVVVDTSGGVIPGATVTLRSGQRVERSAVTNSNGEFRFESVAPGAYDLDIALPGFRSLTAKVTVGSSRLNPLRLILEASGTQETVTVTAETPMVDAMSANRKSHDGRAGGHDEFAAPMAITVPAPFNTEAYDKIDENKFRRVSDDPLSTFSIDVDTASYSNVRRFLNQGTLPPADAVRVEELINYFRFTYKNPDGKAPFSVTTEVAECPWNPRHRLALIGLQARRLDAERTPPRNLVFLLDVSGSMATPDKLPLVKTAMRMLADTLRPEDRVALVVYAGASGLVLPSTSGERKAEIQKAIADLEPGGSTNGASGIQLAYNIASQAFIKDGINRVILATDGDFNVGVTSQGELIRLIEEKRDKGIFLSVLGVGTGNLKDSTMEKLADRGNGNYSYLDSLHEARRVLIAEAGSTLVTVAKDVKIQVEFNPRAVGAYKLIGYENRILAHQDFNDDKKDAGEIGAGHTVTALYEIIPPGQPIDGGSIDPLKYQDRPKVSDAARTDELMTVKLRYKQPDGDTSQLISTAVPARDGVDDAEYWIRRGRRAVRHAAAPVRIQRGLDRGRRLRIWRVAYRGEDTDGYRAEFVRLIDLAAALDAQQMTSPQARR